jgi:hypothetical protein
VKEEKQLKVLLVQLLILGKPLNQINTGKPSDLQVISFTWKIHAHVYHFHVSNLTMSLLWLNLFSVTIFLSFGRWVFQKFIVFFCVHGNDAVV